MMRKFLLMFSFILFLALQPIAFAKVTNSATWWGDSLTAGAGGNGVTAPSELAKILKIPVLNKGVGGEGSSEIAVRSGARKMNVKFWGTGKKQGDWIQYQVVPDRNILRQGTNLMAGSVGNCIAILKFDGTLYSIKLFKCKQNFADSDQNFEIVGLETTNAKYQIIWAGRNNAGDSATVVNDVNSMVKLFRQNDPKVKVFVLSVLNGAGEGVGSGSYAAIQGVNYALKSLNVNFIDVRQCLIQDALRLEKLAPTAQDSADIQNDLVPSQLRSDGIHLNAFGYHAVAVCVANAIKKST